MDHFRSDWPLLVVAPSALRMVWRDQALQWLSIREDEVQVILQGKQMLSCLNCRKASNSFYPKSLPFCTAKLCSLLLPLESLKFSSC